MIDRRIREYVSPRAPGRLQPRSSLSNYPHQVFFRKASRATSGANKAQPSTVSPCVVPNLQLKYENIRVFHEEINYPHTRGATRNAPLLLAIETTTRCNFKCVHCFQTFNNRKPTDLSPELFQNIVPLLKTTHELYLFGDGEVLLDIPRHLAMIARIYQEDPSCSLGFSTNGKLLTQEIYELYAMAGIQYIQLSVDAATKELYEDMRRGGSFEELNDNLEGITTLRRRSKARQPQLHLATVISMQNYQQLPLLAEFAKKYDFSYWYINAEYPHNPGRSLLRLTPNAITELQRLKAEIIRNYGSHFFIVFDPCIGLTSNTTEKWLESKSQVFCTVPWQRFELKADGDVKVCPYYLQPICSLKGRSFQEVWNGKEFRDLRMAFADRVGIPSCCINCNSGMRKQYLPGYPGLP
jgi:MoaA/NifB/PqqE/SkfB family radical SAM enzyme